MRLINLLIEGYFPKKASPGSTKPKGTGFIVYEGPSLIDGGPIVAIINKLDGTSRNKKTGPMAQTYIMRSDVDPVTANKSGMDKSCCGDCDLKGTDGSARACYVNLGKDVWTVWNAYKSGSYATISDNDLPEIGKNVDVRVGSYGDPASVPVELWLKILEQANSVEGYTQQWDKDIGQPLMDFCMASVHSEEERDEAQDIGFRTYRTIQPDDPSGGYTDKEVLCPHTNDPNHKCYQCGLCGGNTTKQSDFCRNCEGSGCPTCDVESDSGILKSITSFPVSKASGKKLPSFGVGGRPTRSRTGHDCSTCTGSACAGCDLSKLTTATEGVLREALRRGRFKIPDEMYDDIEMSGMNLKKEIADWQQLGQGTHEPDREQFTMSRSEPYNRRFHLNTVANRMLFKWQMKGNWGLPEQQFLSAYKMWRDIMADVTAYIPTASDKSERSGMEQDPIRGLRETFPGGTPPKDVVSSLEEALRIQCVATILPASATGMQDPENKLWGYYSDYENFWQLLDAEDTYNLDVRPHRFEAIVREAAQTVMNKYDPETLQPLGQ